MAAARMPQHEVAVLRAKWRRLSVAIILTAPCRSAKGDHGHIRPAEPQVSVGADRILDALPVGYVEIGHPPAYGPGKPAVSIGPGNTLLPRVVR
jgi:hypothetical protein